MKCLLALLSICGLVAVSAALAAAAPAVKGITVSPAIIQISLSQHQTSATFASQVTNNTATAVVLKLDAEDFTSLNQTGGISFLVGKTAAGNPHGLAASLLIASPQIALGPGQSQVIPVTVQNADKLAAGGHYAALTYALQSAANAKGNNVAVNQTVSSLIFLSTYGQGTQTIDLTTPVIGSFATAIPQNLNIVFGNSGNTQTTPRGMVEILNPSSKVVSRAVINVDSALILPQSKRLFSLALAPQPAKHVWPGIYTLRIVYNYDGQKGSSVYEQRFLFINVPLLIAIIVIMLAVVILITRRFMPESLHYHLRSKR